MGVRAFVKKVKRAFPDVITGYLTVGESRIVNIRRDVKECRLHFTEPDEWRITTPSGVDAIFKQMERAFVRAVEELALPHENAALIAHVQISDQMWREFHQGVITEAMIDLREWMVENIVVRKNDDFFEYRPLHEAPEISMRIPIQCEPGWFQIIGNCLDRIRAETQAMEWKDYRLNISCVKEKFAGLRIYFQIKEKDGRDIPSPVLQGLYNSISNHIGVAETLAHSTCEVCGEGGKIHGTVGEHLQTLCDHHGSLRKRGQTPKELEMMFGVRAVDGLQFLKLIQQEKENDELRIRRDGSPQDGTTSPA